MQIWIYTSANLFARAISFLAIPLYANIFSPNDFGIIEMVVVSGILFSTLLNGGLDTAQSLLFSRAGVENKKKQSILLSSILQFQLIWGIAILLIALVLFEYFDRYFTITAYPSYYFVICFIGVFFSQILIQGLGAMRLLGMPWLHFLVVITQAVAGIGLLLFFVVVMGMGIVGVLIATALTSVILAGFVWVLLREYFVWRIVFYSRLKEIKTICLPLIPVGVATYFLMNGNRWLLQYHSGEAAVGLFVIASKFSMLATIFFESFRMAFWPHAIKAMKSLNGRAYFLLLSNLYVGLGAAGIVFISFLSPYLLKYFTASSYFEAWPLVGIFCWQIFFYVFALIFSPGIWASDKTFLNLPITLASLFIGFLISYILIPKFGAIGAAISNVLIFMIYCGISIYTSEIYYMIGYPLIKYIFQVGIAVVQIIFIMIYSEDLPFEIMFITTFAIIAVLLFSSVNTSKIKELQSIKF